MASFVRNVALALLVLATAESALSFNSMFTGGAVLLQDKAVAVWGTGAAANGKVSLEIDGKPVVDAPSDGSGNWKAQIPAQSTSWSSTLKATSGQASAEVTVSFGIVVLCSGQSNSEWTSSKHL
jgi:hypothetical protein